MLIQAVVINVEPVTVRYTLYYCIETLTIGGVTGETLPTATVK